jgi:hypothetical protein
MLQPGALRDVLNFECSQSGGYSRIGGYERIDGRAIPSSATYVVIQFDTFVNTPTVGQTIIQANTNAQGTVALINDVLGQRYLVICNESGSFNQTDDITIQLGLVITAANTPFVVTSANSPYTVLNPIDLGTPITTNINITSAMNAQFGKRTNSRRYWDGI